MAQAQTKASPARRPVQPGSLQRRIEVALTLSTLLFWIVSVVGESAGAPAGLLLGLRVAAYLSGGWFAATVAVPQLLRGRLDVDFLMLLAAVGAALVGRWSEGIVLLFLFSLSNTLQAFAMERSRKAVDRLIRQRPHEAAVRRDGVEAVIPIEQLRVRDVMIIRPGQMVPADGVVRDGISDMDESSITGESMPVSKASGDPAYAGAMNGSGALEIEVARPPEDSTLARIVRMIETAEASKARVQRFLETFESAYAWTIVTVVTLLIAVPTLMGREFAPTFYRAMVILVVASPCALIISTPAAILSAIARGARSGVLFKGGAYLERMSEIQVVVFDKTGTLTTGKPGVTDIVLSEAAPPGFTENDLLGYAAALEARSEHTIAREILRAARDRNIPLPEMADFVALPGRGIHATLGGFLVWIGGNRMFEEHGEAVSPDLLKAKSRLESEGKSVLILHRELERRGDIGNHEDRGGWLGLIALADTMREDAPAAVAAFRRLGVSRTVMLTGDNENVAAAIARAAGIDEWHANLMPEDKVRLVNEWKGRGEAVMMIGDGVNDAPALANASIGVAMGAAGTDLALESAHCVLMGNALSNVPFALELSRRAVRIIKQNLGFSLGVILVLVTSAFLLGLPLPFGVVGHEGSTLLVCANGLRLLAFRSRYPSPAPNQAVARVPERPQGIPP